MLFLTYWELNEDTPIEQRLQAAQTLMSKGLFPGDNIKWSCPGLMDTWVKLPPVVVRAGAQRPAD